MKAIRIEQSREEVKLAFEFNSNSTINRIRLARARLVSPPRVERPEGATARFNFKSKVAWFAERTLILEVQFRMSGVRESPEDLGHEHRADPFVEVNCTFEVEYLIDEGFVATTRHANAFKDGNAVFNLWPYFREYLQESLQRMGLPPLVAPFLRLQPKPDRGKRKSGSVLAGGRTK